MENYIEILESVQSKEIFAEQAKNESNVKRISKGNEILKSLKM